MKPTGWYRIGIVLSVLWCFFIVGVTMSDYNNPKDYRHLVILERDTTKPHIPHDPPGVFDDLPSIDEMKPVINYGWRFR